MFVECQLIKNFESGNGGKCIKREFRSETKYFFRIWGDQSICESVSVMSWSVFSVRLSFSCWSSPVSVSSRAMSLSISSSLSSSGGSRAAFSQSSPWGSRLWLVHPRPHHHLWRHPQFCWVLSWLGYLGSVLFQVLASLKRRTYLPNYLLRSVNKGKSSGQLPTKVACSSRLRSVNIVRSSGQPATEIAHHSRLSCG